MNPIAIYHTYQLKKDIYVISTAHNTLYTYLIIGSDRAAIVDTGFGLGPFYETVSALTDKEIVVINTHGHLDHVGANSKFKKAYMHKSSFFDLPEAVKNEVNQNMFQIEYIKEGSRINLGNKTLLAIEAPSHSNMDVCYLLEEDRILFSGDIIDAGQVLLIAKTEFGYHPDVRFKKHLDAMKKLQIHQTSFDYICPGHNGTPVSPCYIDHFIGLDEAFLRGELIDQPINHYYIEQSDDAKYLSRVRRGLASVIYRKRDSHEL